MTENNKPEDEEFLEMLESIIATVFGDKNEKEEEEEEEE
jgi:hypothetical protein